MFTPYLLLTERFHRFPDDAATERWFVRERWPNGMPCSSCELGNLQARLTRKPWLPPGFLCRDRYRHARFQPGLPSLGRRHLSPRATEKSRSGQDRSQEPGLASDAVAQQSHGHIRFKLLLKGLNHVQGGPAQDGHDGGGVAPAQAAVVLPELHVQGAVQTVLNAPVATDEVQQGLRIHGAAGDVVA